MYRSIWENSLRARVHMIEQVANLLSQVGELTDLRRRKRESTLDVA